MFSQVKPEYVTSYSENFVNKNGGKQEAKKHSDNIIMNLTMNKSKAEKSMDNTIYKTSFVNNWFEDKNSLENKRKTVG